MKKLILVSSLLLAAGGAFADHHGKSGAAPSPAAEASGAPGQDTAQSAPMKKGHGKAHGNAHGKETSAAAKAKNDDKPAAPAEKAK